ncbi:MAG: AAA family ATPase, partial [Synergistaceae bacterium]|nr:AAA family ATPase [Synergistaceae bacterium]
MKILDIRFKNLNSLRGEWHIDLQNSAYVNDGIFAITGPTGAGKTTIFDAVCLALYSQTHRLGRITGQSNEIMSKHTNECYAQVV